MFLSESLVNKVVVEDHVGYEKMGKSSKDDEEDGDGEVQLSSMCKESFNHLKLNTRYSHVKWRSYAQ